MLTPGAAGERRARPTRAYWALVAFTLALAWLSNPITVLRVQVGARGAPEPTLEQLYATTITAGASFCALAAGVISRWLQPTNRTGLLLTWLAAASFAEDLQLLDQPVIRMIGLGLKMATVGVSVHTVLAFPEGRLTSRWERLVVGAAYAISAAPILLIPASASTKGNVLAASTSFYPNPWVTYPEPMTRFYVWVTRVPDVLDLASGVVALATMALLVRRYLLADKVLRRSIRLVLAATVIAGMSSAIKPYFDAVDPLGPAVVVTIYTYRLAALAVPLLILMAVLRDTRVPTTSTMLRESVDCDDVTELQQLLRTHLGDERLRIHLHPEPPPQSGETAFRNVVSDGRTLAWIEHHPSLAADRASSAVAAVAGSLQRWAAADTLRQQAVQFQQLHAELLSAQHDVERDLHDGVQARLVAALISVRQASQLIEDGAVQTGTGTGPEDLDVATRRRLDLAATGLQEALADLRRISQGIRLPLAREVGLVEAVRQFADGSPVPVEVSVPDDLFWPDLVSEVACRVVLEGVTNAIKHADAQRVTVQLSETPPDAARSVTGDATRSVSAVIEVSDDGRGGARIIDHGGLAALRDRIMLLGGTLTLASNASSGSSLRVEIPFL